MIHITDVSPVKSRTTLTIGGQSFAGRVMRIAVSADGTRLYAGTASGVWRSDDGGLNWFQINWPQPPPDTIVVPGALPSPNIHAIWVSPANANVVLVGAGHDGRVTSRNGIYRSLDAGASWVLAHQFPPSSRLCTEIVSPPGDPATIYAAGENAIAVSTDGGATFVDRLPWGAASDSAWHVTASPIDNGVRRVFAVGFGRVWVSLDGGTTWVRDLGNVPGAIGGPPDGRGSGGNPGEFAATNGAPIHLVNPDHPDRLYAAGRDRSVWSADYSNFAATSRGVWTQLPLPADNVGSGRFYLGVKSIAPGQHLLFHSDSVTVRVCAAPPTDASSWHSIDPNHQNHVDPHDIAISPNFSAAIVPSGIVPQGGSLWLSHDGGVSRSDNAGQQWNAGGGLSTLAPLNITAAAAGGQTALCVGTGDNNGFYSMDAGVNWKSQDYVGGDNDCCFVDPKLPTRLLVFAPRNGPDRPLRFYASGGGVPDGTTGTSQVKVIPGPTPFPLVNGFREDAWTSVSFYVFRGYRPLILTRTGEAPIADLDFVTIRTLPDQTRVVLRTTKMTTIAQSTDWDTTATADGPGVAVFQQGPVLPTNNVSIVQASGGHASPTIYVRDPGAGRLWKWTAGMAAWQEITYAGPTGPMFAAAFFVDPYRPDTLYIVDSRNGAIYRSNNGGASAIKDDALTAAVTENGAFKVPLDDSFYDTEGIINDMLFDPDDPARRFVVAYTGAYFTVDGLRWGRMMSTTALPQHTQMAMLDTVSDACNHALYIATGGRGMLRLKPLPVAMRDTNVTSITGRRIVGPLTSWQTPNGPFTVEHLAGRDANGHLIVFWWSPPHDWQAIDVTAITGRTIDGPLTSWQTPNGPFLVEHLAARDANGHLIAFWWSPQHDWQAVDITAITGRAIMTGVTSWQTPNGPENVEHLAACDARAACACSIGRPRTTGGSSTSPRFPACA